MQVSDDTRIAEGGNTDAMTNLGFMYHYGTFGFPDYAEALKWYQMAVKGGNARACIIWEICT